MGKWSVVLVVVGSLLAGCIGFIGGGGRGGGFHYHHHDWR